MDAPLGDFICLKRCLANNAVGPSSASLIVIGDVSFGQEIFNIAMAEVETKIEPDSIGNDIGRESVAFVCVHEPILPISAP